MRLLHVGGSLVCAIALVLATPVALESTRWWRSARTVAELRLSARQAAAIDGIYRRMTVQSADCARSAEAARRRLDDALLADGADDAFAIATSRLADTESECRRTRTLMLYRMFRELSVEQRQGLAAIAARTRTHAASEAR
jgi:hypothetical protein